jgi:hypothetical protein
MAVFEVINPSSLLSTISNKVLVMTFRWVTFSGVTDSFERFISLQMLCRMIAAILALSP